MKILTLLLLTKLIIYIFLPSTYANNLFANMTLRDINANLERLNNEKNEFLNITNSQRREYGDLINFIRTNLTKSEFDEIKIVVEDYIWNKDIEESILKELIKNNEDTTRQKEKILRTQANFYKSIAKFVEKDKRDDFIEHIVFNIETSRDKKNLIEEIIKNENELETRITSLQQKVQDHQMQLSSNLDRIIKTNVSQRINLIVGNEKYKLLNPELRNNIYINFIQELEERLSSLDSNNLSPSFILIKSKIIETMIDELKNIVK